MALVIDCFCLFARIKDNDKDRGSGFGGSGGAPINWDPIPIAIPVPIPIPSPLGCRGGGIGGRGGCEGGGIGGSGGCSNAGATRRECERSSVASLPKWKSAMQNNLEPSFVSIFLLKKVTVDMIRKI